MPLEGTGQTTMMNSKYFQGLFIKILAANPTSSFLAGEIVAADGIEKYFGKTIANKSITVVYTEKR